MSTSAITKEKLICNLMIVGAAKSGTTSLHHLLSRHPDINMSVPKETQYFVSADKYRKGPRFHNSFFQAGSYLYHGEASPHYFSSEVAIKKIKDDIGNLKIIIILRHPIDRAWSHYRYAVKKGLEKESFINAVRSRGCKFDHDAGQITPYSLQSNYSHFVPLWINTFGKKNVYIIKYDDFIGDTDNCLKKSFEFLKVRNFENSLPDIRLNRTSEIFEKQIIPNFYKKLGEILPQNIKDHQFYIYVRKRILKKSRSEHSVREYLSKEETDYIYDLLLPDIRWYEDQLQHFAR